MSRDKLTPKLIVPASAPNNELEQLREENTHLKTLLSEHGIQWEKFKKSPTEKSISEASESPAPQLSTTEKVTLFRHLFRWRTDVYPLRWESAKGKSGYSPTCGNEWKPSMCNKPRIKCGDCDQRLLLPVTDQVVYEHLTGQHILGVYPLLSDNTCYFLFQL